MFKKLLFVSASLLFFNSCSETSLGDVQGCLAGIYTAEKAFQAEYGRFTSDLDLAGFNKAACPMVSDVEFVAIEENYFEVVAINYNDEVIGQVNSLKVMEIY